MSMSVSVVFSVTPAFRYFGTYNFMEELLDL